jgi:hypothetical protein
VANNEARTHSGRRGKVRHPGTKPKTAPVVVSWVHPAAIQEAKNLADTQKARGAEVHVEYDTREGCMWIRNGL